MENSKRLLEYAVAAIKEASIPDDKWSIGGGTVLAQTYNHRLSKDIDVFIEDIQSLSSLSPRFNNQTEDALDYEEMSQYISLAFPEGKVDFIASPQITDFKAEKKLFFEKEVMLDDPIEIVSKKIYFRGDQVLPRDIFDLAIVYDSSRKIDLINTLNTMPEKVDTFKQNFSKIIENANFVHYSMKDKSVILDGGKKMINKEIQVCQELVQCLDKIKEILAGTTNDKTIANKKDVFNQFAKKILDAQNKVWTEDTNSKIIKAMYEKNYSHCYIEEAIKHSPIPEKNTSKILNSLDNELSR